MLSEDELDKIRLATLKMLFNENFRVISGNFYNELNFKMIKLVFEGVDSE